MDEQILEKARKWTEEMFDEETRAKVRELIDNNPAELTDAFYRELEFGTGGLRGVMGVGTNRMNKYTVGMATQGLANYLIRMFPEKKPISIAVSYDSRNNSPYFARIVAEVFSANGFHVYLFDGLRPTPELSFAIRRYGCQSGVMITASHNPKEYNGYKAYWDDGAQMIAPHDENVIAEVGKITNVEEVKWQGKEENIQIIGKETDEAYLKQVESLSLSPEAVRRQNKLRIVYTPLHGTGITLVPEILKRFGFENIILVGSQVEPDGNFPTVHSPNPEEPGALKLAIEKARESDADLVLATDPDADRVGIALKNNNNEFILLNGNQTAAIVFYYILKRWKEENLFKGNEIIVSTVVTSGILLDIGKIFGVESFEVLTGFKFIADVIRRNEGRKRYVVGGEESYGLLIGDFVRDKDAVSACALIAEAAAWAADQGKTLFDLLIDIYLEIGFYKESLISITRKGKSGADEIRQMMIDYRQRPPAFINKSKVISVKDYLLQTETHILTGNISTINLPKSDVLQFFLADGSKISIRPSGTEPKIKFYFSVFEKLENRGAFDETEKRLNGKITGIISALGLDH